MMIRCRWEALFLTARSVSAAMTGAVLVVSSIMAGFALASFPDGPGPLPWPGGVPPAITAVLPVRIPGMVVSAPHDGFDRMTGEIASAIAESMGCGLVVARGFRAVSQGVFLNVNRPTRSVFNSAGKRGGEENSDRAAVLFETYAAAVRSASGLSREPIALFVEIHGHSRKVSTGSAAGRKERVIDVIEVATVGLNRSVLGLFKSRMRRDMLNSGLSDPPQIFIDALDSVVFDGRVRAPFRWRAEGAKAAGILTCDRVCRAIHIELPPSSRLDPQRRRKTTGALVSSIGWLARITGVLASHMRAEEGKK